MRIKKVEFLFLTSGNLCCLGNLAVFARASQDLLQQNTFRYLFLKLKKYLGVENRIF
jgi:hypothetical protein